MFSVQAKPVAVNPAATSPSAGPADCRLRTANTSRTGAALASSSTTGAIATDPSRSAAEASAVVLAIHSVAKLLASMAISAAAPAPQPKQNSSSARGRGAARPTQPNAASSGGTGSTARPSPTKNPGVPVCSRTSSRIASPDRAKAASRATSTHVRTAPDGRASTEGSARNTR